MVTICNKIISSNREMNYGNNFPGLILLAVDI